MKAYGDTLQNVSGYALANTFDGGLVITGSSTLNKSSFLDFLMNSSLKPMQTETPHGAYPIMAAISTDRKMDHP
jgi:hypothetical protein